ncbi:MAG: type II secretion system F family protein [Nanoarchaeota archaeon]
MVNFKQFTKEGLGKKLIPDQIYNFQYKKELQQLYEKLYFDNLNNKAISNIFALSVCLSMFIFVLVYDYVYRMLNDYFYIFAYKFIIIFLLWFSINLLAYYFLLFVYFFFHEAKFRRAEEEIEKDLPEFLDNLISNLKGGVSLEKALIKSVRPEQKALLAEVTLINQKIMMGDTVFKVLKEFRLRFNSAIINRTFFLIEEGIRNGGNLAKPLERIADNLKKIYDLENETRASAEGFAIVIKAITLILAPLLFALALTLLTFVGNLFQLLSETGSDMLPISSIPIEFSNYLVIFSYSMILLITFFSSMITSELKNEKIYNSIKYLPIYLILGIIIFNVTSKVLLGFFGSII